MPGRYSLLFLGPALAFAASFPEYPVKAAKQYPGVQQKSGLVAAAVALESGKEQRKYFGADLQSRGYIPVLLVVENHDPDASYLFRIEAIVYTPAGQNGSILPEFANAKGVENALAVASVASGILSSLTYAAAAKRTELRFHLVESELRSATLSPGRTVHGFVFVPWRRNGGAGRRATLTLPFAASDATEALTIDLPI